LNFSACSGTGATMKRYFQTRAAWRSWLRDNFQTQKEIWLVLPKKSSGKTRIEYNDAVEEALCFGWIDSTVRSLDEKNTIQRFSRRKPGSTYSQANIERLKWLYHNKLIHPTLVDTIKQVIRKEFIFPNDILREIKQDPAAWDNYNNFPDAYKRIRVAFIDGARKRPQEFKKRLAYFIKKTRENKMVGYGGINKYYT
jgi:uncharacterized protein YdeI (YjbR/CyaY-like superfamily)